MTLMRDPSTGALQRDGATGKLMRPAPVANDCEFCDPGATPSWITFTFGFLSECTYFIAPGSIAGDYRARVKGVSSILSNTAWPLPQYGEFLTDNPCYWQQTFDGYFGNLEIFAWRDGTPLIGGSQFYPIDYLSIEIEKTSLTELLCTIVIGAIYPWGGWSPARHYYWSIYTYGNWNGFAWEAKVATIDDCMDIGSLANQTVCGSIPPPWLPACDGGTASIEEGQTAVGYQAYRTPISDAAVQWSPGSDNFEQVNDAPGAADDDSSYTTTLTGWYKDIFNYSPLNIPAGSTITNVQVVGRFKRIDPGGSYLARLLLRVNGTIYYGPSEQFLLGAYFTRIATWATNPDTGAAWTVDDINNTGSNPLQNIGYECMGFVKTVRCTQIYMKVNYTKTW